MSMARTTLVFILALAYQLSFSQKVSKFDPHEAFAPEFYPDHGNKMRTADGRPGPEYWQNRADYAIDVSLDDIANTIAGNVTITYTNNSPQQLSFVWLQL